MICGSFAGNFVSTVLTILVARLALEIGFSLGIFAGMPAVATNTRF
ncbi:hypothetical protein NIES2098_59020 [Calothrix sp. NIES-2098]|nr:hypothetical protein NIES2098_59020 [Calothrix sp. NIES-2098]